MIVALLIQIVALQPRGLRPLMVRDNRHDSAYIFGAICPQRAVGAAIITPGANTEMMNLHLAEISTQVALGALSRVIRPGGVLIAIFPTRDVLIEPHLKAPLIHRFPNGSRA